tara:strand:+ start:111 stop:3308 length:3198 start_codon:yes stop_codon:yes gene_type:complete
MPGQWHNDMEKLFPKKMQEIKFFCSSSENNTCRRADILLNNKRTLEIQHSRINENEIIKRFNDWNIFGKEIIWLVDGNTNDVNCEKLTKGNYLIQFNKSWKYKSFIETYDNILLDINDKIFKIELKKIKCKMILLSNPKPLKNVIDILKNNPEKIWKIWDNSNFIKPTLKIYQQGAGNGKTYGIWKSICENEDKDTYVIVTKQHSAKNVIYEELMDQTNRKEYHVENLTNKEEFNTHKHYAIKYTHKKSNRECKVLIGTIDSYCYNLSGTLEKSQNFFEGILKNISVNGLTKVTQYGFMNFAGQQFFINRKSEIWIDEVQDLPISYLYAFTRLILETCCDVNIVGDKLQTLEYNKNFLTEIVNEKLPNIDIVVEPEKNDNRRIKVKGMHIKINELIEFEKYKLEEINCDKSNLSESKDPLELIDSPIIYANDKDENKISDFVSLLIKKLDFQVNLNNYIPEDFMFIFPIMKSNILAIELQTNLQKYWLEKFNDKNYIENIKNKYWEKYNHTNYTQYVHLHKHTEGQVINTRDSIHATRIMSIRTSKGDGRPVVFILGTTEKSLKLVSSNVIGLVYESHLHVALTRAKNKIYFGLIKNNDNIHSRFKDIDEVEYLPSIKRKIQINKLIEQTLDKDKIQNILLENNVSLEDYFLDNSKNNMNIKEQVDWGYHCIKYAVYVSKIIFNIIERHSESQEYYKSHLYITIQKISDLKITRKSTTDYWKYLKDKQYKRGNKKMKEMPICVLNKQHNWIEYIKIIENTMKTIQKKINDNEITKMNVYESIVFVYMIDIYNNQSYSKTITPMDLYNITHFFHEDKNTKEKALLNQLDSINEIVESALNNNEKNMKWNLFKHIKLDSNDDIQVKKLQFPIIGYGSKISHIMLKSSISKLNFWDIMIECLMERFLIYNPDSEKDKEKYKDKEIETMIFILDEEKCIKINWNWDKNLYNDILEELKLSIEKYYGDYHIDIYKYLNQIKLKDNNGKYWGKGTKYDTPFSYISEKIKVYPSYIYNLIEEFHEKWSSNKEWVKEQYVTYDSFNGILNIKLKELLNKNFKKVVTEVIDDEF